jgi:hypothetical protein
MYYKYVYMYRICSVFVRIYDGRIYVYVFCYMYVVCLHSKDVWEIYYNTRVVCETVNGLMEC